MDEMQKRLGTKRTGSFKVELGITSSICMIILAEHFANTLEGA